MIAKHTGPFILSGFQTLIDGMFCHAGKGINAVMLTRVTVETILSWYNLRTFLNNHPCEGNIKGIEKPSGLYS